MKKYVNVVTVGLLLFISLYLLICFRLSRNAVQAEPTQAFKLEFEAYSIYDMTDIDAENCFVYKFNSPNDGLVVYKLYNRFYIIGKEEGQISYGNFLADNSIFVGLSNEYLLFLTEDGLTAFQFPFKEGHNAVYSFDELSDEEQIAFIYPISYEIYE